MQDTEQQRAFGSKCCVHPPRHLEQLGGWGSIDPTWGIVLGSWVRQWSCVFYFSYYLFPIRFSVYSSPFPLPRLILPLYRVISLAEAPPTGTHAANADADADAFKSTPCPIQRDQESWVSLLAPIPWLPLFWIAYLSSPFLLFTIFSPVHRDSLRLLSTPSSRAGSTPSTAGSTPSTTGKESSTPPAADTLPLDRFTWVY